MTRGLVILRRAFLLSAIFTLCIGLIGYWYLGRPTSAILFYFFSSGILIILFFVLYYFRDKLHEKD